MSSPVRTATLSAWTTPFDFAGGAAGPDFFIYMSPNVAVGWHNDHTVWGEVRPCTHCFITCGGRLRPPRPHRTVRVTLNTFVAFYGSKLNTCEGGGLLEQLADQESLEVVLKLQQSPTEHPTPGSMAMIIDPVPFELEALRLG